MTVFIKSSVFTGLCVSVVQTVVEEVTLLRKAEALPKHVKVGQTDNRQTDKLKFGVSTFKKIR